MNDEFKKISKGDVTRYVLENASAGGTSSGSVASVSMPMGGTRKRGDNLIAQEGDKKNIPASTPRNFVAKNAKTAGAGAHKDKKKAAKQGQEKHKKPFMESFNGEYDDEAGMAKTDLHTIARAAQGLIDTIDDKENLPEWAQEKLAKVEGMLVAVWDYLKSQEEQGIDPRIGEGDAGLSKDAETNFHAKLDKLVHATFGKRKSEQGVAEGVATTMPMPDAVKVLRQYGADHFKTTSNELHFYKNGRPFSVDLIFNDDATRSVNLSQLNSATRSLKGQGVEEGWDDIKKFGKKAAVAGAIGLGIGAAHASGWSPSDVPAGGHNQLPDIVAHVKFKVGDKEVSKEINLGSHYRSPGEAGKELENFLKSKGIKFYEYSLERVKPKANDKMDSSPATSDMKGSMDTTEPAATGPSTDNYMAKDNDPEHGPSMGGKFVKEGAKVDRQAKHITASMMKKGKSKKDAESIAWAHIKHPKNESVDPYFKSLNSMVERQLEPTMDLDAWNDNFQNADPQKYHQFKNKSPEKKK